MAKHTLCDVCEKKFPDYEFQYRIKKRFHDGWAHKFDVCEECFETLQMLVTKGKKKGKQWLQS